MPKIKHIAIATQDAAKTAEFYKEVFGLREIAQLESANANGFFLSDGNVNMAILDFQNDAVAGERGKEYSGIHHIGFYVDDLDAAVATVEDHGGTECPGSSKANRKYKGPDGLLIDLRFGGGDEQSRARSTLYKLTGAAPAKTAGAAD